MVEADPAVIIMYGCGLRKQGCKRCGPRGFHVKICTTGSTKKRHGTVQRSVMMGIINFCGLLSGRRSKERLATHTSYQVSPCDAFQDYQASDLCIQQVHQSTTRHHRRLRRARYQGQPGVEMNRGENSVESAGRGCPPLIGDLVPGTESQIVICPMHCA
jgi:hypothetical protein